ncbi:toxin-antitoxin system YwqK family antitoxin [Cyclobacterium plantarum]|uniref:MORN repeat variant n=1 Tax=Cyclobacterium plantarum TaxID=2716263 RepID=A0ABX0H806_9BACT|nr:hypothetical protein [Cyclobacterium plantarum]NHE56606.1 hypothetical protein [Cyclobacterium plantarum]
MKNKEYVNGQKTFEQSGERLTYFYKDGKVKAEGASINGLMQGEWKFYRESGQLWQIGNFRDNEKHGNWIRYDKLGNLEYDKTFINGKIKK